MSKYVKGSMVLYEDNKTVVISTGLIRPSQNAKTGAMSQTFILKKNRPPTYANKGAGCEGCPVFEGCYVRWEQAPTSVHKTYKKGRYETFKWDWENLALLANHPMRVGSAGEPTEMPAQQWMEILAYVGSWTGYTHKWKDTDNLEYRAFCMASVHTVDDMKTANKRGWRTYRVGGEPMTKDEVMCPYYTAGVQCADCKLCSGTKSTGKNIYAPAHGARKSKIK